MRPVAFLLALLTAGCASAVGWGKRFEVVHSNSRSITVKYDSLLADLKDFAPDVDAHCGRFGKEAVPEGRQRESVFGAIQTVTFRCE